MSLRFPVAGLAALLLTACAAPHVLLLGEQHDVPEHQRRHQERIDALAAGGALGAVVLEMAERGTSTAGLPRDASEDAVRAALRWNTEAWPWAPYAPAVMAAVRAGVPVLGGNLPRDRMRPAMADAQLDTHLPADALAAQRKAIRDGHCGLLPESQVAPMTRVQIARDRAMALTLAESAKPGRTAVLVAGAGHVDPRLGVPVHLPPGVRAEPLAWPAQPTGVDYCEQLRQRFGR